MSQIRLVYRPNVGQKQQSENNTKIENNNNNNDNDSPIHAEDSEEEENKDDDVSDTSEDSERTIKASEVLQYCKTNLIPISSFTAKRSYKEIEANNNKAVYFSSNHAFTLLPSQKISNRRKTKKALQKWHQNPVLQEWLHKFGMAPFSSDEYIKHRLDTFSFEVKLELFDTSVSIVYGDSKLHPSQAKARDVYFNKLFEAEAIVNTWKVRKEGCYFLCPLCDARCNKNVSNAWQHLKDKHLLPNKYKKYVTHYVQENVFEVNLPCFDTVQRLEYQLNYPDSYTRQLETAKQLVNKYAIIEEKDGINKKYYCPYSFKSECDFWRLANKQIEVWDHIKAKHIRGEQNDANVEKRKRQKTRSTSSSNNSNNNNSTESELDLSELGF